MHATRSPCQGRLRRPLRGVNPLTLAPVVQMGSYEGKHCFPSPSARHRFRHRVASCPSDPQRRPNLRDPQELPIAALHPFVEVPVEDPKDAARSAIGTQARGRLRLAGSRPHRYSAGRVTDGPSPRVPAFHRTSQDRLRFHLPRPATRLCSLMLASGVDLKVTSELLGIRRSGSRPTSTPTSQRNFTATPRQNSTLLTTSPR